MADTVKEGKYDKDGSQSSSIGHTENEEDCAQCEKIVAATEHAGTVISMHVNIKTICPPKGIRKKVRKEKDEERDKKEKEKVRLLERICALRNTSGGCLVIYFENMNDSDTFLGDFDEMIDDKLQELIEDGTLYSESYLRKWHQVYKHCLCITCNPSTAISTLDYKAQMSLNKGFGRMTALNIRYLLARKMSTITYKEIPFDQVLEQSNIQLKSFRDFKTLQFSAWPDYIMDKLRLREYIAAFANQRCGGYYFLGIAEKEHESQDYHRKCVMLEGFSISDEEQIHLKTVLLNLVKTEMLWVDMDMNKYDMEIIENSIKFTFRQTEKAGYFVLEVFVYPVQGVVFHDQTGPLSFMLSDDCQPTQIDRKNWLDKVLKLKIPY